MPSSELKADLARMKDTWREKKDKPPGPDDGVYEMQLISIDMKKAQTSGKLMSFWDWTIISGEQEGMTFRDVLSLEGEGQPYRVAQRIAKLGYDAPEDPEDLLDLFEVMSQANPIVRARTRRSGDFINVTIQELLDASPAPPPKPAPKPSTQAAKAAPAAAAPIEDQSSPFQVGTMVELDYEGKVLVGRIVMVDRKAGCANFEDETQIYEEVPLADLRVHVPAPVAQLPVPEVAATPTQEAAATNTAEIEADAEKQALLEFCLSQSLPDGGLNDQATVESLVGVLKTYEWKVEELSDAEKLLLTVHGIEVITPKPVSKKKKPKA